jgi:hypothetical protein
LIEIKRILLKSPRKWCRLDPIPTKLMLSQLSLLIPVIQLIVNTAIREGMPSVYKESMIAPLLKKKDSEANVLANYRPISNLPFLSKVIERAVFEQIFHYLDGNNLLDPLQSAYRPHHSCETALLHVLNHALVGIDEHKVTLLVLIDLSSAFDCVDHKILSTRLQQLGIIGDAHRWIMSYLTDRKQRVIINYSMSTYSYITCGVPQGSVLGPLLFLLYLTGLRDIIEPFSIEYMLYADDSQLYLSFQFEIYLLQLSKCKNASRLSKHGSAHYT